MSNIENSLLLVQAQVCPNKNLVYNKKKYPVDFNLIKQYSNYFYEKQSQYDSIEDVEIQDEKIQITDDDFNSFVQCCQNQKFSLSESNAYPLYQLSIKYDVPNLKKIVNEYIGKNDKNLIFKTIEFKLNCLQEENLEPSKIDLTEEETKISANLIEYIQNEEIFSIPIQSLYRIFYKYSFNINELDQTNQNKVIDFLFKCLDKYGKKASILFSKLNLDNRRIELYARLNNYYSDLFDFNMIDPHFLMKTTNDLLSELKKLQNDYSNSIAELKQIIQSHNDQFKNQNDQIIQLKKLLEDQISKQNESFSKTENDIKSKVNQQLSELNTKLNQTESDIKSKVNQQLSELNTKLNQIERDIKSKVNQQLNEMNAKLNQTESDIKIRTDLQLNDFNSKISENKNKVDNLLSRMVHIENTYATKAVLINLLIHQISNGFY